MTRCNAPAKFWMQCHRRDRNEQAGARQPAKMQRRTPELPSCVLRFLASVGVAWAHSARAAPLPAAPATAGSMRLLSTAAAAAAGSHRLGLALGITPSTAERRLGEPSFTDYRAPYGEATEAL